MTTQQGTQPRDKQCAKVRFPTLGSAQQNLYHILSIDDPGRVKPVRAYPCPACAAWHLTSQRLRESVDLTDPSTGPLLVELEIYESADIARMASVVADATPAAGRPVTVAELEQAWALRHEERPTELTEALHALRAAGIVTLDDAQRVTVTDSYRLRLSAENLDTLEDSRGDAVEPARWMRHPRVPGHLRDLQATLTAEGRTGTDRRRVGVGTAATAVPTPSPSPPQPRRGASPATLAAIAAVRAAAVPLGAPAPGPAEPVAPAVPTPKRWAGVATLLRRLFRLALFRLALFRLALFRLALFRLAQPRSSQDDSSGSSGRNATR